MSDEERTFVKSELSKIKTPYKDEIIGLLSSRLDLLPSDFTRELGIPQEDLDDVIQSVNHPAQAAVWVGPVRQGQSEKTVFC